MQNQIQTTHEVDPQLQELLAKIIGGSRSRQTAEQVLARYEADLVQLYHAQPSELRCIPGVGHQVAERLAAALRIGMQVSRPRPQGCHIHSPADAAQLLMPEMALLEVENLRVILLDRRNRVKSVHNLYVGSVNSSQVRIGEIYRPAVRNLASAIILIHNHPSGDPSPSPDDIGMTRAVVQAGTLLDIQLLDHLIIGGNNFVSLKERGLGFS